MPSEYNVLSNEQRSALARKKVIDFVNKFKKENDRLPSQQEIRKQGKFDFETVKKAIESGEVKTLPLQSTKGQFTKIPVEKDLRILDQSKVIKDAFKSGKAPDLKDVQKILKTNDPTKAANRITQLASTYIGDMEVEGIKPKFQKAAKEIIDTNTYDYTIRDLYEKSVAKSVGERRSPSSIRTTTQRDVIPDVKGYSIDEPAGVTSSVRNKTTPYAVFSQVIDTDINKGDKYAFDSIKSKKEIVLQNAITQGDKKEINKALNDFNKTVSEYEIKLNENIKPGEKKIKLFRASLDNPENTIKNFNTLPKQYQEAFKNNFVDRGYSYQVPKDIKTIYQIGEELRDPKIASEVSKKAAKGQARIYSEFLPGTQTITGSVGDYIKDVASEIKAGKIITPFLKVLAPVGTAVGAYDVAQSYAEGKPLPETVGAFLGVDPIIEAIREESRLTPEASEIKKRIRTEELEGREYTPGLDVLPPSNIKQLTESERQKVAAEEEQIKKQLEEERLATKEERGKVLDYVKERFSPFGEERIEMEEGGFVEFGDPETWKEKASQFINRPVHSKPIEKIKPNPFGKYASQIAETRLGPEQPLSKYKSYSELELLGNIEAKKPNFQILEENILDVMPMYNPKDIVPKGARPVMPNEYDRRPSDGILELARGGRVNPKK
jgi:hypothetical protein